jgi:hypothetical protein
VVTRTSAGRTVLRLLMVAAVTAAGAAHAQQPKPAQIDRNGVLILVRATLLALDQANKTGNYTVLRDLAVPGFQVNTAARLAEIFAGHRRDNLDLSGVAVIDPQLTVLPQIEANGMMRMAGFFPSVRIRAAICRRIMPSAAAGVTSAARSGSISTASSCTSDNTCSAAISPKACASRAAGERAPIPRSPHEALSAVARIFTALWRNAGRTAAHAKGML